MRCVAIGEVLSGGALSAILTLATHYFAIFIVVSEAAWLLYSLGIRRATLAAIGAVGLFCAAYLPLALRQAGHHQGVIGTSFQTRIVQVPVHLLVGYGVTSVAVGKVALVVTSCCLHSPYGYTRRVAEGGATRRDDSRRRRAHGRRASVRRCLCRK